MKDAVTNAKNSWIEEKCKLLNESVQRGTKDSWELLGKLKSGLDRSKTVNSTKMKKPDGSLCETPEENAEVFRQHFENLYSTIPNTDESVLEHVEAVLIPPALDALPDNEEIRKAHRVCIIQPLETLVYQHNYGRLFRKQKKHLMSSVRS